ncbi:hypothetical protein GH714_035504 [Hevea brasiliensis]|uniref:CCHC-type domain-containing protein n=1 Tax=Hevea brasiliensis TaxID=3981 RepID=A0A6A6KUQ7_HEVBR|nr:hypothetical protein GH714_035504 [Hevea brasiliensis]
MPATAGRVRMPANNRVHSSAALQTHGIWQSAIGFQGLLALARITGSNADEARGACKRCGRVGHLAYQCRNFLSVKDDNKEKDPEAVQAAVLSGLEKIKGNGKIAVASKESEEEEEESDTSDSDVDSEIERIIAERYGKKGSSKRRSSRKEENSDEGSDSDSGERKKRGRYSDDSESDASDDSGRRHRRKSRKPASPSDSDLSGSDDSRVGRGTKRSEKRSKKRHHEEDE